MRNENRKRLSPLSCDLDIILIEGVLIILIQICVFYKISMQLPFYKVLISLFGTNKFTEINSNNISTSFLKIANFIRNRKIYGKTEKDISIIAGFGIVATTSHSDQWDH